MLGLERSLPSVLPRRREPSAFLTPSRPTAGSLGSRLRGNTGWLVAASALLTTPAYARTILFVGNSFTFGAGSPVQHYHPDRVTDLTKEGIGGVPALFATFAEETKQDWKVSLETSPGKDLAWHLAEKRQLIDRKWDVVLLQGFSTLDAARPGDPTNHAAAARALAAMLKVRNKAASIHLTSTWSRADLTYRPGSRWSGQPITRMADDLYAANAQISAADPMFGRPIPVGAAWNIAIRNGIADGNPFDGIAYGKVDLWTYDQYHASSAGYYLSALTIFGAVTGIDPRTLGPREQAAEHLGLDPLVTQQLQRIAAEALQPSSVVVSSVAAGRSNHASTSPDNFRVSGRPLRSTFLPSATRIQPSGIEYSSTSFRSAPLKRIPMPRSSSAWSK